MTDDEARRAAIRRQLIAQDRAIEERYRGRPIDWSGPLETDDDIAAAAVAMQRQVEAEARAAGRFRRRTPEEDEELEQRALDVLQRVPRVPPDPGDEMPDPGDDTAD